MMENNLIQVLDKGYVRLVDKMGSDLSVVNAARASFAKEEFYFPSAEEWRLAPEDKKQGSQGIADPFIGSMLSQELILHAEKGEALYNMAMENGIAAEQARLFLPAYSMYVIYRWSCSLQSAVLFLTQRLSEDSQVEIQKYASAVYDLIQPEFPMSIKALMGS